MTKNRFFFSCFLILTSIWWGWTILVDMVIIRTVFSTLSNFFEAGDLGIAVFSKLNNLEVIVSSVLLAILSYQVSKGKKTLVLFGMGLILWLISMTYFTYLTPKLVQLTSLWKESELTGVSPRGIADVQQEHQYYHQLYIGLDVLKLLILSALIPIGVMNQERWT